MQPLKLALLKAHSQEAADLIAEGDCAAALPLAAEAVKQGQHIFKTGSQLQLFPLYLLARANGVCSLISAPLYMRTAADHPRRFPQLHQ